MRTQDIREGFALETQEGLIFTVKGLIHPPDAVVAYLRYVPDPRGDRERNGVRYRRVYHFDEQVSVLETRFPDYLFFDPVFGARLQGVSRARVRRVYDPRRKLAELRQRGPGDEAEEAALHFAELLCQTAEVPAACLGISGSILLGLHAPSSDLDLVVYSTEAGWKVHRALRHLLDDPSSDVTRLDEQGLRALHTVHAADTGVPLADFVRLQARKVNEGRYRGREYFMRFVKDVTEIGEKYGDRRYTPLGPACIQARVADDGEAIFTPCRYGVKGVQFLSGEEGVDLWEAVSYRGRFCEQARAGENIIAQGELERVVLRDGAAYHRLIVGGRRGDYITSQRHGLEADAQAKG
jgi:predicted nucleotidyltransferase